MSAFSSWNIFLIWILEHTRLTFPPNFSSHDFQFLMCSLIFQTLNIKVNWGSVLELFCYLHFILWVVSSSSTAKQKLILKLVILYPQVRPPQWTPNSYILLFSSTFPLRCLIDLQHLNELIHLPLACLSHSVPYLSKQQFKFFLVFPIKRKLDLVALVGIAFCGLLVALLAFLHAANELYMRSNLNCNWDHAKP